MNDIHEYNSLKATAVQIGVPCAWLKGEAEAGRVPSIRVGRRLMFKVPMVVAALDRRAVSSTQQEAAAHA